MKAEEVIKRLEEIASRVDSAFCMTIDSLLLFGSSLYKENPRDIDVVVTYHTTPEDEKKWVKHVKEAMVGLPLHEHYRESREYKTTLALKRGMKNVDIHFAKNINDVCMKTKCFVLAWSRTKPNIKENLANAGYGSRLVKLLGEEIGSMREQLREKTEESEVLSRVCYAIVERFEMLNDKDKALVALNVLATLPKRLVSEKRIREILKKHGIPEEWVIGERHKGCKVFWTLVKEKEHLLYNNNNRKK
jgi:hypothetical protein